MMSNLELKQITEEELYNSKLPFFENIYNTIRQLANAVYVYCPEYIHGQKKDDFMKQFSQSILDLQYFLDGCIVEQDANVDLVYDVLYSIAKTRIGDDAYNKFLDEALNECVNRANGVFE